MRCRQELQEPKDGYKQTEISMIPHQWKVINLDEVGVLRAGGTPSRFRKEYWENGTIPWLSSGEVRNNIVTTSDERITELGLSESAAKLFPKGTVLIAITGQGLTRGRTALLGIDSTTNQSVIGIIHKKNVINNIFLWYYLQHQYWKLRSISQGSNQAGLNLELLRSYKIALPPVQEQEKIASYLSRAAELIRKTDQIIEQTQRLKRGLLYRLFGDSMKNWPTLPVEEIKAQTRNAISMGPFGSNIKTDNFVSSGVPVVRGINLTAEPFNLDGLVFITEKKADELRSANSFPGDIVFTHRGTLGQVGIIPKDSPYNRFVISQSQMKMTCDQKKVHPLFVYYFFKSPWGQRALLGNISRTGVPAIGQPTSTLRRIMLPVPTIPEQQRIASILERTQMLISTQYSYSQSVVNLKRGLMQKLLTGKIRVKV